MKKCQFCGAELPDEASFCLQCSSVLNCREESNTKKSKSFYIKLNCTRLCRQHKRLFACFLVIFFALTVSAISAYRIKNLPLKPQNTNESETVLVPVTEENGETVTDSQGDTVYDIVTVETTTKKPSFISEIINSIKDKDKDKDDNKVSNSDTTDSSGSDISQKPASTENDTSNSSKEPSTDNSNVTEPTQSQAPTETEPTTEEEIIKENPAEVFEYEPYQKSTTRIQITKYKGNASLVTVPDYIDGLMVVSIKKDAFKDNSKIKTIDIIKGERSFLWLSGSCFNNLSSFTTLNLYNNDLGTSGDFAVDCPIKDINIDFWQYKFVDGVLYQHNSREWQVSYFAGNPCYDTLDVKPWCHRIDLGNLSTAKNLKVINANKYVTYIPSFSWCYNKNLEAINVEEGNSKYFSKDGVLFGDYNSTGEYTGTYPYSKKDKSFKFPEKDNCTLKLDYALTGYNNPYLEELFIPLGTNFTLPTDSRPFPNLKKIHFAKNHPNYDKVRSQFMGEVDYY